MEQSPSSQPRTNETYGFEKGLERGYYLGILENYMAKARWDRERVARDTWQNFFDANKFTLDGVKLETQEDENGATIRIKGDAEYPYTRLLHLGGGYKEDPKKSAGGHHEGTKIMALHMLRDFGFSKVLFRSQNWELEFYLDRPPEGSTEEDIKGLYVKLKKNTIPHKGNDIFLTADDPEMTKIFSDARNLFYHSNNPDFQNPTTDNKKAGFSFHHGTPGNFYLNGQRIHYDTRGKWETLPHFTFWSHETPETKKYTLNLSRDRDVITEREVELVYLEFLVDSLSKEELEKTLAILEPFYTLPDNPLKDIRENYMGNKLLELVVKRYALLKKKMSFDKDHVALDEEGFLETLKGLGFKPCHPYLASVGMIRASDMKNEILELKEYLPTPEHEKRIENLQLLARDILQTTDTRTIAHIENLLGVKRGNAVGALQRLSDLNAKTIRLFEGKHPYLKGLYDEQFVWVSKDSLETPNIEDALATYLHELCHKFGDDQSEIFSYALTDVLRRLAKYARTNPEKINAIQQEWETVRIDRAWKTIQDLDTHLSTLSGEETYLETQQRLDARTSATTLSTSLEKIITTRFTRETIPVAIKDIYYTIQNEPLIQQYNSLIISPTHFPPPPSQEEEKILNEINTQLWKIDSSIQDIKEQINNKLKTISPNETIQRRKGGKWETKREKLGIPQLEAEIELKEKERERLLVSTKELREKTNRFKNAERIELSLLQKMSATTFTLYGVHLDPLEVSRFSNFFHASLKLLYTAWKNKPFNREPFKQEFDQLLAWAKAQSTTKPERITKILKNEALSTYGLAQHETDQNPLNLAYAQFCYEALEN